MSDSGGDKYLMQDGTYADFSECSEGDDGVLRHAENGVAVALRDDGEPMTLALVTQHNVEAAEAAAASTESLDHEQSPAENPEMPAEEAPKPADEPKPAEEPAPPAPAVEEEPKPAARRGRHE